MPNDSAPEIIVVNSQTLQDEINTKLPSQRGFGSELMASNVIQPIIDLTEASGGGAVATDLLRALSFGSQTTYEVENATTTVANTVGFWRVFGTMSLKTNNTTLSAEIILNDGSTDKAIFGFDNNGFLTTNRFDFEQYDFIVFLAAGASLVMSSSNTGIQLKGSVRQIADGSGVTINPNGYPV